jgi:hypothetical protein
MRVDKPRLTVLQEPCDECPFKGRFDLRAGRLKDIMDETVNAKMERVLISVVTRQSVTAGLMLFLLTLLFVLAGLRL